MKHYDFTTLYFDETPDTDTAPEADKDKDTGTPDTDTKGGTGTEKETEPEDERKKAKYSDEDLDRIISRKIAKLNKQHAKDVDEAAKYASMTEQEKIQHERDTYKAKYEALEKKNAVAEMEKTARATLAADGINVPDAVISALIREDAEETDETVKAFAKAYKAAVEEAVKAKLNHKTPTTGKPGKTMTKADIMKIKNPTERQAMIAKHPELFKNYRGQR